MLIEKLLRKGFLCYSFLNPIPVFLNKGDFYRKN